MNDRELMARVNMGVVVGAMAGMAIGLVVGGGYTPLWPVGEPLSTPQVVVFFCAALFVAAVIYYGATKGYTGDE